MGMGMGGYSLQHALGNLHVLHGDKHAQLVQRVHVADLIQELHTTARTSSTHKKNKCNKLFKLFLGGETDFFFFFFKPCHMLFSKYFLFFPPLFFSPSGSSKFTFPKLDHNNRKTCLSFFTRKCRRPDERSGDGQDGPDEPCRVNNDETLQILPQSAMTIKKKNVKKNKKTM